MNEQCICDIPRALISEIFKQEEFTGRSRMAEKQWKIMEGAIYDQGKTKYSGGREKKLNRGREIDASTGKKRRSKSQA